MDLISFKLIKNQSGFTVTRVKEFWTFALRAYIVLNQIHSQFPNFQQLLPQGT